MGVSLDNRPRGLPLLAAAAAAAVALAACNNRPQAPPGKAPPAAASAAGSAAASAGAPAAGPPAAAAPALQPGPPAAGDGRARIAGRTRVALLLPLSGRHEALGRALLDAALLAAFRYADDGLVLMPFDTSGAAARGAAAAGRALAAGADLIVGPVFADVVAAAAPPALAAGVSVLALSNDSSVARPGVYLAGLLPETQVARVVDYAARRGRTRFAALLPEGRFGERVRGALLAELARRGLAPAATRVFGPGGAAAAVAALDPGGGPGGPAAAPFDALLVAAGGDGLTRVAAHLGGIDLGAAGVQVLGLASWAAPGTGREPALVGGWFAAVPEARARALARAFEGTFGAPPPRLAAIAYDLAALAAIRAPAAGEAPFPRPALTAPAGFSGAGGVFRFRADGRSEHLLEIRRVGPRGDSVLERARPGFGAAR